MEGVVKHIAEQGAVWGAKIVGVIFLMIVAFSVAGGVRRMVETRLEKRKFDKTLSKFFANLARYAIIIFSALGCLGVFGVETTSFAAVIGAAGLAIGLAFQGTLSNFAAGIMLLIFRPFRSGDFVEVAGTMGTVQEIELFTTELTALDNRRIIIPNSKIFGDKIENYTHHDTRRVDITVGVAYDADIDEVRKILEKCVAEIPDAIKDPPSQIVLKELADSSVNWGVRVWCKTEDYWPVREQALRAAKRALDEANVNIPFPQMDVHLDDQVVTALGGKKAS